MTALDELAAACVQRGKWTKRRNDLIGKARTDGASLRSIADAAGLSHTAIAKILNRKD